MISTHTYPTDEPLESCTDPAGSASLTSQTLGWLMLER